MWHDVTWCDCVCFQIHVRSHPSVIQSDNVWQLSFPGPWPTASQASLDLTSRCRDMPRQKWKKMVCLRSLRSFRAYQCLICCVYVGKHGLYDFVCFCMLLVMIVMILGVRGFIVAFVFCAGVSGDYFLLTKTLLMFVFLGFAQGNILRGLGFPTLPCASSCPWSVLSGCPVWNAQRSALPSTRVWKCQQWTLDDSFSRFKRCYCTIKSLWLSFTFASTASKHHVDSKKKSHAIFILWLKKVKAHLKHTWSTLEAHLKHTWSTHNWKYLKVMSQYVSICLNHLHVSARFFRGGSMWSDASPLWKQSEDSPFIEQARPYRNKCYTWNVRQMEGDGWGSQAHHARISWQRDLWQNFGHGEWENSELKRQARQARKSNWLGNCCNCSSWPRRHDRGVQIDWTWSFCQTRERAQWDTRYKGLLLWKCLSCQLCSSRWHSWSATLKYDA